MKTGPVNFTVTGLPSGINLAEFNEDLAWLDEQIRRVEDSDPLTPEMVKQKLAYLERLRRVRERLVGGHRG